MKPFEVIFASVLSLALLSCGKNKTGSAEKEAVPKTVEGILSIGHEVRSLSIEGDTCAYWVADKTGKLVQLYDSITGGVKNGRPVYAKLQVVDVGHSEEGFAGGYDRVLQVTGIGSLVLYDINLKLFREGIRAEAVDGTPRAVYVLFGRDSLTADLYVPGAESKETLERRTLPGGGYVWNVEDDDTKNLRCSDGNWTISQRGKLLYKQQQSDNDNALGTWEEEHFEGLLPAADCPGVRWQLYVRHRKHSGDGRFLLRLTYLEAENGKNATYTYIGERSTQRGMPADDNAVVWQLVADRSGKTSNFFYDSQKQELTLLNQNFEKLESSYTLKRVVE